MMLQLEEMEDDQDEVEHKPGLDHKLALGDIKVPLLSMKRY